MANATFHTGCPRHPKILVLSDAAFRLWFNAVLYCQEHLTDGLIPKVIVPSLKARVSDKVIAELCQPAPGYGAPLWHDCGDTYRVHDYLGWQDSKAEIQKSRERLRERVKLARARRRGEHTDGTPAVTPCATSPVTVPVTPLQPALVMPLKPLGTTNYELRTPNNERRTERSAPAPPGSTSSVWDEWRAEWHANPKRRPLPLTPVNGDVPKFAEVARRFPDEAGRRALLHAYFGTENREILKNPFSVGWFLHWADKLQELLLADDARCGAGRDRSEWSCDHEPPCGARAQHAERLKIDAMKASLAVSA